MSIDSTIISTEIRELEHTGENRCTPCTVVNLAIVGFLSLTIGVFVPVIGAVFAVLGVIMIYLRGYLVPGTPTLTKRYFPDRVLRRFDKPPAMTLEPNVDPEAQLLVIGAVEPADNDLQLTDTFATEWDSSIEQTGDDLEAQTATVLGLSDAEIREVGEGLAVIEENTIVARWASRAALIADLAAIPPLRDRTTNWAVLSESAQRQLLAGLRIFLESCPCCGGELAFSTEPIKSCCRTGDILQYACEDCNGMMLEVEQ